MEGVNIKNVKEFSITGRGGGRGGLILFHNFVGQKLAIMEEFHKKNVFFFETFQLSKNNIARWCYDRLYIIHSKPDNLEGQGRCQDSKPPYFRKFRW
jgi:hypothetical protein